MTGYWMARSRGVLPSLHSGPQSSGQSSITARRRDAGTRFAAKLDRVVVSLLAIVGYAEHGRAASGCGSALRFPRHEAYFPLSRASHVASSD